MKNLFFALCMLMSFLTNEATAQYRGMTFDEMMKPLLLYRNFFDECNNQLIALMESAQEIEPYIDRNKDPNTWNRYTAYYNSVVNEYNNINQRGTNQNTRSNIANLRRRFSEINSIIAAYNRRADLANAQYHRLRSTNQRCDRYYSEISLDEFLDGKTPVVNYYEQ